MNPDQLQIVPPEKRTHGEQLYDLTAKVFPDLGYYQTRHVFRTAYFNNSHYDWNASRIGLLGDTIVTHYGVFGYDMRVGSACVRVAGVGAVATDGDFRRKGLMNRTAEASLQTMRELGYDMSLLFGIRDFYHKFGYARAWSDTSFFVYTSDLPHEKPACPLRKFPAKRVMELADLYNAAYATYTGAAVRPTYRFGFFLQPSLEGYLWTGNGGIPCGYVIVGFQGHRVTCHEYCGDVEQALRALRVLAQRRQCSEVVFEALPYMSALAKRLRRGNCRTETRHHRSGSAMARMVNLPQALGKLTGELTRRLQASPLASWRGDLLIADSREEVMLSLRGGRVSIAPMKDTPHSLRGGDSVVQLLLGTDAPREVVEAGNMQLSGEAGKLIEVLFPAQYPQLSRADRY